MEGWGGRAPRGDGCRAMKRPPPSCQWVLGCLGDPPRVPLRACLRSCTEPVARPSTPWALARPLPAHIKSESSLGKSAAAFPLRLCFPPSARRPWPGLSRTALSSAAVLLRTCCQRWVAARSRLLPFIPLVARLSEGRLWGHASLCLVPVGGACKDVW